MSHDGGEDARGAAATATMTRGEDGEDDGAMRIRELWVYPVKSLRGVALRAAALTPRGVPGDRRFMLLRVRRGGGEGGAAPEYENMHVSKYPAMCLFTTALVKGNDGTEAAGAAPVDMLDLDDWTAVRVTHTEPLEPQDGPSDITPAPRTSILNVPLRPAAAMLRRAVRVIMHASAADALLMPDEFGAWFGARLGFEVALAFIDSDDDKGGRPVLGNIAPNAAVRNPKRQQARSPDTAPQASFLGSVVNSIPKLPLSIFRGGGGDADASSAETDNGQGLQKKSTEDDEDYSITFADCAPYLVVSAASLDTVSARLPGGARADVTKFRPNMVIGGAGEAWEEDYWAQLEVSGRGLDDSNGVYGESPSSTATLELTANCGRCASLNVDYATGRFASAAGGQVLKSLQRDRRVDAGVKYSPVFGRYAFLGGRGASGGGSPPVVRVGDGVRVGRRNAARTTFKWPGLGGRSIDDLYPV